MKNIPIFLAVIAIILNGCCSVQKSRETIFQYSTINALLDGIYDGDLLLEEAKKHGDFGIGTYNALDGEMVFLDGIFYQIKSNGKILTPAGTSKSPFVITTFFNTDTIILANKKLNFEETLKFIEKDLPSKNIFYAIRINGNFPYMRTRSVDAQQKPYPKMVEAIKNQKVFESRNVRGTVMGFYFPEYSKGLNIPGFHLHFLDDNKKIGGHVLDFTLDNGIIEIDDALELYLVLPSTGDFLNHNFIGDKDAEVNKVEKK